MMQLHLLVQHGQRKRFLSDRHIWFKPNPSKKIRSPTDPLWSPKKPHLVSVLRTSMELPCPYIMLSFMVQSVNVNGSTSHQHHTDFINGHVFDLGGARLSLLEPRYDGKPSEIKLMNNQFDILSVPKEQASDALKYRIQALETLRGFCDLQLEDFGYPSRCGDEACMYVILHPLIPKYPSYRTISEPIRWSKKATGIPNISPTNLNASEPLLQFLEVPLASSFQELRNRCSILTAKYYQRFPSPLSGIFSIASPSVTADPVVQTPSVIGVELMNHNYAAITNGSHSQEAVDTSTMQYQYQYQSPSCTDASHDWLSGLSCSDENDTVMEETGQMLDEDDENNGATVCHDSDHFAVLFARLNSELEGLDMTKADETKYEPITFDNTADDVSLNETQLIVKPVPPMEVDKLLFGKGLDEQISSLRAATVGEYPDDALWF